MDLCIRVCRRTNGARGRKSVHESAVPKCFRGHAELGRVLCSLPPTLVFCVKPVVLIDFCEIPGPLRPSTHDERPHETYQRVAGSMPESSCVQDAVVPYADEGSGFSYSQGPVWLATKEPTHARMEEHLSLVPDAPGSPQSYAAAAVVDRENARSGS